MTRVHVRPWSALLRVPPTLVALLLPGALFAFGLLALRGDPRYAWVGAPALTPWELWAILASGLAATFAGLLDFRLHRAGVRTVGRREHQAELAALGIGGLPLFLLMAAASVIARPRILLLPVIVAALATTVMICYDELRFHRRCGTYETLLHRVLVLGNGIAWLAWCHWCFVRAVVPVA